MRSITLIVFALIFSITHIFAGGPWAEGKGNGYAGFNYGIDFNAWTVFSQFKPFLEVGLHDKVTLELALPFTHIVTKDNVEGRDSNVPGGNIFGLSNFMIGGKYHFDTKKVKTAVGIQLQGRTWNSDVETGLRTGYDRWRVQVVFHMGQGFEKWYWQASPFIGINTNNYSEDFGFQGEIGWIAKDWVTLQLYIALNQSMKNGSFNQTDAASFQDTNYFNDNESYLSFGPKAIFNFNEKIGMTLQYLVSMGIGEGWTSGSEHIGFFYNW